MASNKVMADLAIRISTQTGELNKGLRDAKQKVDGFSKGMKALGGLMAGVFALNVIKNFAMEVSRLAAVAEGVSVAFAKLKIPIEELREATRGTVSDLDLMKQAVKASEFGIPLENLGLLLKFAAVQAQKLGENVDFMLESLIGSLSTQSKMRLDNLGISMSAMNKEMRKGATFADAAFTLIGEKLEDTEGLLITAKTKTDALGAAYENLQISIGTMLNESGNPFIDFLTDALKGMQDFIEEVSKLPQKTQFEVEFDMAGVRGELLEVESKLKDIKQSPNLFGLIFSKKKLTEAKLALVATLKEMQDQLDKIKMSDVIEEIEEPIKKLKKKLDESTVSAAALARSMRPVVEEMDQVNQSVSKAAGFLHEHSVAALEWARINKELNEQVALAYESSSNRQTDAVTASANEMKVSMQDVIDMGPLVQGTFSRISDSIVDTFGRTTTAFGKILKSLASLVLRFIAMMVAKSLASSIAIGTTAAASAGPIGIALLPGMIAASSASVLAAFTKLPKFASGGVGGGLMKVGERGAETIFAPQGSRVVSHADSMKALSGNDSGGRIIVDDIIIRGEDLRIVLAEANRKYNNSF